MTTECSLRLASFKKNRWNQTFTTGFSNAKNKEAVLEEAHPRWGLAARGALVENNSPEFHFKLNSKKEIWSDHIQELYAQAIAGQWNPDKALNWPNSEDLKPSHSEDLEKAIVQILSYMIENENAALIIPARFLAEVHPHYREVQALLALQVADETRHIDVFTRRIQLYGYEPSYSTSGGQLSLQSLINEKNFSVSSFLLAVLGEGTFVDLLQFLAEYAPDQITKDICRLAAIDESRHVAFGMSHLIRQLELEPELRIKLILAMENRFDELSSSSGLNAEVFDSLMILAAKDLKPQNIENGFRAVQNLLLKMAQGRRARLERLGFGHDEAKRLSDLHTRNFM